MDSFLQPRLLIICLTVAVSNVAIAKAQCYYPAGAWAKDQLPCDKYAYTTLCCPPGWTCFSNSLCIVTDPGIISSDLPLGTSIRGTCTNPNWDDEACGDFCLNDPVSSNNGSVIPCGDDNYCCQPDSADGMCDCSTGKGTFQVSNGTAQTIIGVFGLQYTSTATSNSAAQTSSAAASATKFSSTSATPTSSSTSTSGSHSSSTSDSHSSSTPGSHSSITSSSTSQKKSMSKTGVASTTGLSSASIPTQTNQQVLDTSTPITQTTPFKAGVGAAAGVAFALIVGCIIFFLTPWWQRRHNRDSQVEDAPNANNWLHYPTIADNPSQIPPNPHPYDANPYSADQSRTALAEQIAHNRRTPGPIEIIEEHNNPYSDRFMAGGTGR